ncbi:unnamed protein product [Ambrosiozyma monospora]|uniref:Unnamed protein product n=1 Tax=Ambrosiozyma monospora TaxID=43982 RepID=A0ACB5TBY5_AMBMO|nr:unnamed protein product [Ambrosiozyma monospora]
MGMWYTKAEQSRRTAYWYLQTGVAGIIGSLLSFGFQHVHSTSIENWQILFIFMGLLTCILGVATFLYLPDNPMTCKAFSDDEKLLIMDHIRENQTGVQNRHFKWYQLREVLFKDWQTWLLFTITFLFSILGSAFTTFSSLIIKSFGFTDLEATFMQFPIGFVSIFATLICCFLPCYYGERCLIMFTFNIIAIVGLALQITLDNKYKAWKLIGVYMMKANSATLSLVYNWCAINTSGHTKRLARNALILIAFCLGSLVAPQHFRDSDAPLYVRAKIALIIEMSICAFLCLVLRFVMIRLNKKKDEKSIELSDNELHRDALFLDITDIENRNFRYEY